jgi:hypothetical protein
MGKAGFRAPVFPSRGVDEEASIAFFATTVQFLPFFPLLLVYIAEV